MMMSMSLVCIVGLIVMTIFQDFWPFRDGFKRIQGVEFRLDGHSVKVLLPLFGCSSWSPSSKWDVELSHLRNHGVGAAPTHLRNAKIFL